MRKQAPLGLKEMGRVMAVNLSEGPQSQGYRICSLGAAVWLANLSQSNHSFIL